MICLPLCLVLLSVDPSRVVPDGVPPDARLGKPRTYNDYFPFVPPTDKDGWDKRREAIRTRALIALGLWPMPHKDPLRPVIHGKIERDGFTIEKVYFASLPGHYVTGNLYRPTKQVTEKRPAVLFAHGHWANGRFHVANEQEAQRHVATKAEPSPEIARYFMQAIPTQLARMGFVVFQFDMVGYADSTAIAHSQGFLDVQAQLYLQSAMGLQTWNCLRAFDFLSELPDVDPQRIGVTGASGGGTQTFILGAIDDRPAALFPAVMVSTGMQGGCICENAPYLRIGMGNVDLAAVAAPRPLGLSAANDWTREIETKGLPELKSLYRLYGIEDKLAARCWPEYPHNYNQPAREMMYAFFAQHLQGKQGPVREEPFVPLDPKHLRVFDDAHPRPQDELQAEMLARRQRLSLLSTRELDRKRDPDQAAAACGTAFRVLLGGGLPNADDVFAKLGPSESQFGDGTLLRALIGRRSNGAAIPAVGIIGPKWDRETVVVWVHPNGKSAAFVDAALSPEVVPFLERGAAVWAIDVLGTGETASAWRQEIHQNYSGYTFGYNLPILAQRAQDILTTVVFARRNIGAKRVHVVGFAAAGPWVLVARSAAGDGIDRTAADLDQFTFERVDSHAHPMMLPGALRYGDIAEFAAQAAPHELLIHHRGSAEPLTTLVNDRYRRRGKPNHVRLVDERLTPTNVAEWLLRPD